MQLAKNYWKRDIVKDAIILQRRKNYRLKLLKNINSLNVYKNLINILILALSQVIHNVDAQIHWICFFGMKYDVLYGESRVVNFIECN